MKKFLIINPFGIGDVLFTTPVIRAIKENDPGCFIGYWCNQRVKGLLENNKKIDKIFALSRGDLKKIYACSKIGGLHKTLCLFFALRREKFAISLDYSLDHRYGLACKLAGIKKRIGYNFKNRGRFLTDKVDITGYSDKHAAVYYQDLLQFIGIRPGPGSLELEVSQSDKIRAWQILSACGIRDGERLIGIAAGGGESWGKDAGLKRWPKVAFAQLADRIIEGFGAKVLLLGDESEKGLIQAIISEMKGQAIDLAGKTSLPELIAIMAKLDLLIANDGGPLHIAAALGRKTVSFFGPVDPLVYGPYPLTAGRHIVLRKKLDCSPCYRNFRLSGCSRDKECLRSISADEAYEAVLSLLQPF